MFKLAVSKKNQNAVLTSAQKILLIVCRKFQNFSKKKEKRMHIIINNKHVLGNKCTLIKKRISGCSLQIHFMKFHENW